MPDLKGMLTELAVLGAGVTAAQTLLAYLFREKLAAFVDGRVEKKLAPMMATQGRLEASMTELERDGTKTGEAVKNLGATITEHMARQTQALTAISTELTLQGKQLAEMRGELNARRDG